jgi:hypothetical protein
MTSRVVSVQVKTTQLHVRQHDTIEVAEMKYVSHKKIPNGIIFFRFEIEVACRTDVIGYGAALLFMRIRKSIQLDCATPTCMITTKISRSSLNVHQ